VSALALNGWEDVRDELRRRIHERVWRPGDRIPGEEELARDFGCARTTVNRAMRDLAEAGYIERRRKAGSHVRASPDRKATLRIPVIRLEVEGRGLAYRHRLLERSQGLPPPSITARLGLPADLPMLHLVTVHLAGGRPFAREDRWLNTEAVPQIAGLDFDSMSVNEWLVLNAPFTGGDISFSAAAADAAEAACLDVAPGAALFVVDRTTWNGEIPITSVRLAYAPGYSVTTQI